MTKNIVDVLYIKFGENMKKRFKRRKTFNYKKLIILVIMLLLFHISGYFISSNMSNMSILKIVLKNYNKYSYNEIENDYISLDIYNYINKSLFNSPINILRNELKYKNNEIEKVNFSYVEHDSTKIYIYNSHQGEKYSSEYLEDYNIVPDVLMASSMLKDKLDNLGLRTVVETESILDYMKKNNLDHSGSYIASRNFLLKAISKYPGAELYIDLHRDSATHDISTTSINNKNCAKIMFVIGLENERYHDNLYITSKLNDIANNKYPNLSRGILKKQGPGVNGIYNQDLGPNVILIEVGGNENNIEEINNTLDLLADIIGDYIYEKE